MTAAFWLALTILVVTAIAIADIVAGNRKVLALREVIPLGGDESPRVSVIVAARNEERNIREALSSLLALDYPDYEVIVVEDRSQDRTGEILNEMARLHHRLKVIHIDVLPAGWLGKNHALWVGSQRATGELLLFTDADIVMESSVVARAVSFLNQKKLDHLALTPSVRMPTTFLSMFGASFIIYFSLFSRPWKAREPKTRWHIGIGAFNLVRASVYRAVGGHDTIRLRPDDDMKLGKIIKMAGYRQDVAYAPDFLVVEWYSSVGEVIRGLEKNAFSGADYSISLVLFGVCFHILCSVWPFVAVFVMTGATRILYIAVALLIMAGVADSTRFHGARRWYAIGYPLTSILFAYILLRTMLLNLVQGGIYWRGTFYSMKQLKANRV
jgi:glycosyltransferase involved in cell wall biosynthesis